jgi:hypothetical protein
MLRDAPCCSALATRTAHDVLCARKLVRDVGATTPWPR